MFRFPNQTIRFYCPATDTNGFLNSLSRKHQCLSLLKLCNSMKILYQIHAHLQTSGLISLDGFLLSEMMRFCALSPFGDLDYARSLLANALCPIPASWNFLIRGYTQKKFSKEAILTFIDMKQSTRRPNKLTFPFLFKSCAQISDLNLGRQIQTHVLKHGVDSDVYIQNTLISFYGSCKEICSARQVFDEMSVRTVVSWNAIISGYLENSLSDESFVLFNLMRSCGSTPDETTMVILLSACTELGKLSLGKWVHSHVIIKEMVVNLQLGTSLVDMYAKCGEIEFSHRVFDRMRERNVWTWSAMILGLAQHGMAKEAFDLFQQMKNNSIKPNYVTFLGVLCACSHAGLVDEGYHFFWDMLQVHNIKPMMTHYSAMVDILGRSGRLEEAYQFIISMSVEPDAVVWRTLLSACSVHDASGSSCIGENVRKKLLELEPRRSGNYVIVANMYAEVGLWEEVANVRRVMKNEGLKKIAGESCIEVNGLSYRFVCGDDSYIERKGIFQLLNRLNVQIKLVGFTNVDLPE